MNAFTRTAAAGAAGAVTTTLLHEVTRRLTPDAPRVDLLGMQALASVLRLAGLRPPAHGTLYNLTLAGDLLSNTAYFALVASGTPDTAPAMGIAFGALAGLGAAVLPPYIGLSPLPSGRTATTRALTIALYTAGGLAAGTLYQAIAPT